MKEYSVKKDLPLLRKEDLHDYLTLKEVCGYLRIAVVTGNRMIRRGELKPVTGGIHDISTVRRYRKEDVLKIAQYTPMLDKKVLDK